MRKIAALTAIALFLGAAAPALADSDRRPDTRPHSGATVPLEAMKQKIDALGYSVRRLGIDDGCFKAVIVDPATGGAVKAKFSLATGELIAAKLAD